MSRDAQHRIRIQRENRDKGWQKILADPLMREAIWELYLQCRAGRGVARGAPGSDALPNMTLVNAAKQEIGDWLENRCMLANHRDWLLLLAEHDSPIDDGRKQEADAAEEGE